jgi:hypothetical protein
MKRKDLDYQLILTHMIEGAKKVFSAGLKYSLDDAEIDEFFLKINQRAYDVALNRYREEQKNEKCSSGNY